MRTLRLGEVLLEPTRRENGSWAGGVFCFIARSPEIEAILEEEFSE